MRGYTREPEVTEKLVAALRDALYANPEMRLGQLLINVTGREELWNVYDETFIHQLQRYNR